MTKHFSILKKTQTEAYVVRIKKLLFINDNIKKDYMVFRKIDQSVRFNTIIQFLNEFACNISVFPPFFIDKENTISCNKNFIPHIFDAINGNRNDISFDFKNSVFVKTPEEKEDHILLFSELFSNKNFFILKDKKLPEITEDHLEIGANVVQNFLDAAIVVYNNQYMSNEEFDTLIKKNK